MPLRLLRRLSASKKICLDQFIHRYTIRRCYSERLSSATGSMDCSRLLGDVAADVAGAAADQDASLILPPYFRTRAIRNVASARSEQGAGGQRDAA